MGSYLSTSSSERNSMFLNGLIKDLEKMQIELDPPHFVRMPNKRRYFYAENSQVALNRLIGKSYTDFTKKYGGVEEARKGEDYVEYYGKEVVLKDSGGKKVRTRYYLRQGRYNFFRGKFEFHWSSFTIIAILFLLFG